MKDQYGREISYLRLSLTDACNLACIYCRPAGEVPENPERILSDEDILRIVSAAARTGIRSLKITGGEPLLRRNLPQLIRRLYAVDGIEEITLTTNGVLLSEQLESLYDAGIRSVNISLDTLDRQEYQQLTGADQLETVWKAIQACLAKGMHVKINCVLANGTGNFLPLCRLAQTYPLDVRFIEMMPIGLGRGFEPVRNQDLLPLLMKTWPDLHPDSSRHGNGPAVYYTSDAFRGSVGFISALDHSFCSSCSRLRMTCTGQLKGCLAQKSQTDLSRLLKQKDDTLLEKAIAAAIYQKPRQHVFDTGNPESEGKPMIKIGG